MGQKNNHSGGKKSLCVDTIKSGERKKSRGRMHGHMYRFVTSETVSFADSEKQNERGGTKKKESETVPSLHH